jgi:antitoxin (DNA-binding transcriptional repressor) of toxin-antitoxin stability system
MRRITATEASRDFSRLLDEVEQGASFLITRAGQVIARIERAPAPNGRAVRELLQRYGPDPEFADAIEEACRFMIDQEPRWLAG